MTKLNTILAGLVAAVGFSTAAMAQEATPFDTSSVQSTKTRAEVRAEAAAALAAGQLPRGEAAYTFNDIAGASTKSRAQVIAEAREARRLGLLGHGEASVFATPEQAELIRAAGLRAEGQPVASVR